MSRSLDRLYELLPVVHRRRDVEQGYPLRALLRVINEQVNVVEEDIARLYDNWFIESCDDWVVPYIGDLIGYRPVHDAGAPAADVATAAGALRNKALIPRREVAHTLGYRRRKGTLALLELLARDVTGWSARAVEFYTLLGWSQHLKHLRLNRGQTANLRDGVALDLIDGPFERLAHNVDVRRVVSHRCLGRYNIPSVGVFVWRLRSYSVTRAPAYCLESEGPQCFTFSVLGHNTPLYTRPEPEAEPTHIAAEMNVPTPIRRRGLEDRITQRPLTTQASATYYGAGKSLVIYAPGWPSKDAPQPISRDRVIPADLSGWFYRAQRGRVGLDPVLGRLVFPAGQLPKRGVWVSYHYAFSADMGGGEYERQLSQPSAFNLYRVVKEKPQTQPHEPYFETINAAFNQWRQEQQTLGTEPADPGEKANWHARQEALRAAVIEIQDSEAYSEPLAFTLETGESLQLRAANRTRPVIRLLDYMSSRTDAFAVSGKRGSRFMLDGLIVTGRGVQINGPDRNDTERFEQGDLCDVRIRHCTLVPGWGLDCDCEPERPNEPSLELFNTTAKLKIEHSIIGSIYVTADEVQTDPVAIDISDSIIDATSIERVAIGAPDLALAFAQLSVVRSTVIGELHTHSLSLAGNSLFMSKIRVGRRQLGCVRFCYVTPVSRTPPRYHCQPDLVIHALTASDQAAKDREVLRVRPQFNSMRYGVPSYCQLADACAEEIKRGADDESEMGAFHDLFQPQREANLHTRLDEYTPAGMEAGIIFVS